MGRNRNQHDLCGTNFGICWCNSGNFSGNQLENWPTEGSIKFDNVKVTYSNSKAATLKNFCFEVKPRNKIGIVGRTGAGKSSIISALFRLNEFEGFIDIDKTSITTVALHFLR